MSDPIDDAYERYVKPPPSVEPEESIECPRCKSDNVDRVAGYRGEYRCMNCGHSWQVGGWKAT